MLLALKVSNFAIIEEVEIEFKPGLNILSGETGAGKSVVMKSLGLLMGEKSDAQTVRMGAEQAVIEGLFDLSKRQDILNRLKDLGIESEDNNLVVRRIVSAQGKNKVYLNDSLSALNSLKEIVSPLIEVTGPSAPLIEITSQHENRSLTSKAYHLELIDQYSGVWSMRKDTDALFQKRSQILTQIEELQSNIAWRGQRLDFLKYQLTEIENFAPTEHDQENLENEVRVQHNATQLLEFKTLVDDLLYEGEASILSLLHKIEQKALYLQKVDTKLVELLAPLFQVKTVINDVVFEVREYGKSLEVDPQETERLEKRLSDFRGLQKKYGNTFEEITNYLNKIKEELSGLENYDSHLSGLNQEKIKIEKELTRLSEDMHKRRVQAAMLLSQEVNSELKDLNMKGLMFETAIQRLDTLTNTGISEVEFMTRVGKGAEKEDLARPLAKFASGGELSRILLALKQVVGHSDKPRTYLFDEVDSGVSGETAEKVGKKLRRISKGQQVICITHLPQVAAQADSHYFVSKKVNGARAKMDLTELLGKARVNEIARLISGEKITKTSLAHAEALIR